MTTLLIIVLLAVMLCVAAWAWKLDVWQGSLTNLAVYDRALSADEILQISQMMGFEETEGHLPMKLPSAHHFPEDTLCGTLERINGFVSLSQVKGRPDEVFMVGMSVKHGKVRYYLDGDEIEVE